MIYFPSSPTTIIFQVIECCKSPCSFIGFIFIEVEEVLLRLFIPFLDSETEEKFQFKLQVLAIVGTEEKKALDLVLKIWQDVSIEEEEEEEVFRGYLASLRFTLGGIIIFVLFLCYFCVIFLCVLLGHH